MLKFLQFINEADQAEGDFTYTTKQGKTDEHVKGFVKNNKAEVTFAVKPGAISLNRTIKSVPPT